MFRKVKSFLNTSVYLLFLYSIVSSSCVSYTKRPNRLYNAVHQSDTSFDALIVPGVPFENNRWDTIMKGRVLWSVMLYKQGTVRNIIYSGSAVYSPYYEAKIMGLYAQQLGVPAAHIFYDTLAQHSTENVFYAYELARKQGFKSIALGTDPVQSSLLKRFTHKRFKTPIYHLPFVTDSLKKMNHLSPNIDPASAKYEGNFIALPQQQSGWKRFRGTMGAYIPWEKGQRKAAAL